MVQTETLLEILTPESPRWAAFADELFKVTRICDGDGSGESNPDLVHRYAKKVMADMGNVDIPGSLAFFEAHGGYCDCEILLNVDPDWGWAGNKIEDDQCPD